MHTTRKFAPISALGLGASIRKLRAIKVDHDRCLMTFRTRTTAVGLPVARGFEPANCQLIDAATFTNLYQASAPCAASPPPLRVVRCLHPVQVGSVVARRGARRGGVAVAAVTAGASSEALTQLQKRAARAGSRQRCRLPDLRRRGRLWPAASPAGCGGAGGRSRGCPCDMAI